MQQATVAIRGGVPLSVLNDTIQPFPTFSEAFHFALAELVSRVPAGAP
jgi:dihydrolipoamide dehydrogenase